MTTSEEIERPSTVIAADADEQPAADADEQLAAGRDVGGPGSAGGMAGRLGWVGRDRVRDALAVFAALAVLAAGWFGWSWWQAGHDQNLRFAATRDAVLDVGKGELVRLNTLDYRDAERGIDAWRQQATGGLLDELTRNRDSNVQSIRDAKTATSAKVLDAAVTKLDARAGTANMIAVLEVTVTQDGGQPQPRRSRLDADLVRGPQGWKVSSLQVVGVVG